jgi:hypothetical protein
MGVCILNKLIALPTKETLDLLQTVFATAPFLISWDNVCVELASSHEPIQAKDHSHYRALSGALGVWYDSAVGHSNLLLPLIPSPEMVERNAAFDDPWGRLRFLPYLNLAQDPIMRRERKAFINSLASRFVDFPLMLTFHNEVVIEVDGATPPQADFYSDYSTRGQVPVQVFTDITRR